MQAGCRREWLHLRDVRLRVLALSAERLGLADRTLVKSVVFLVFVGCFGSEGHPSRTRHPTEENRPPPGAVGILGGAVPQGLPEDGVSYWLDTKDALVAARSVLRLGSTHGGPTLFGRIAKADIDSDGNIVVLDADKQEIRVFDPNGDYVDRFGGRGSGLTELRGATEFHLFRDGRIAVPLGRTGPVKIFGRSEDGWELVDIIDLRPTPANSLCGMSDGRLFSAGYLRDHDTIINEFGEVGIRSFGRGYRYEKPLI